MLWRSSVAAMLVLSVVGLSAAVTIDCDTFAEIRQAVLFDANPGDVVLIAPGQYHVTNNLYCQRPGIIVQGATGNFDDVVLYGNGMNVNSGPSEGFWTAADGIQLRNLTVKGFYNHGIHVSDNPSGNLADNVVISNVKIQDCGERYIKGSGNGTSHNVLVENSYFLQLETRQTRPGHPVDPDNYIGGMDCMHTEGWTIRNNTFNGIIGASGESRGAIFLWNEGANNLIEGNRIFGCGEGINLGNGSNGGTWLHADNTIVRNNFIVQYASGNRPMQLGSTRNCKVYNNTIWAPGNNRAIHIYNSTYNGQPVLSSNLQLSDNLICGNIIDTTTGVTTLTNNIIGSAPQSSWFTNVATADLHLTALAAAAIDHGTPLAEVTRDFDRILRMGTRDIGADELGFPHAGDATQDNRVNVDDLGLLASNYDTNGKFWEHADFTLDGQVNVDDLGILASNYDWIGAGGAALPEPATLSILALGVLSLIRRGRN